MLVVEGDIEVSPPLLYALYQDVKALFLDHRSGQFSFGTGGAHMQREKQPAISATLRDFSQI